MRESTIDRVPNRKRARAAAVGAFRSLGLDSPALGHAMRAFLAEKPVERLADSPDDRIREEATRFLDAMPALSPDIAG
ncbi:hypothetical protein [Verrucomicrobium sp. 3C]|uniref:hypothetical protein n=1 Tax=Verrucomicrobium sp. 3C TaxID=1134055 RepID=UPI00037119B5|nr:hypothetical protein [Verrucomicrobium sp. 3C]